MPHLHFHIDDFRTAGGKSEGLSRGLLVRYDSGDITQEGMGIGSIALKTGQGTYFSSTCTTEFINSHKIIKTFLIDSLLTVCCGDHPSRFLTRVSEKAVDLYMKYPALQKAAFGLASRFRRLLHIGFRKESVPALASAVFTYDITGLTVNVACHISLLREVACKVYILNELGADYFTSSLMNDVLASPPSGWEPIRFPISAPLFDEKNGILFSIRDYASDTPSPLKIFWGREKSDSLCWAGFDFELDMTAGLPRERVLTYAVEFEERGSHE